MFQHFRSSWTVSVLITVSFLMRKEESERSRRCILKPLPWKCFFGICCVCPHFYFPLSFRHSAGHSSSALPPLFLPLQKQLSYTSAACGQLMAKWIPLIPTLMSADGGPGGTADVDCSSWRCCSKSFQNMIKPSGSRANAAPASVRLPSFLFLFFSSSTKLLIWQRICNYK